MKNALTKRRNETDLQWRSRLARAEQEARDQAEPIVPIHAERHGDYERDFVTHVETGTKAMTSINRGGTPVCRWIARKQLSQSQRNAIWYTTRLWHLAGLTTPLTANYGERVSSSTGSTDLRAANEIEARADLHRIQGYVPRPYWQVYENVVRHGIAAGSAGASLANASRNAKHTAFLAVCFVADVIAMHERL